MSQDFVPCCDMWSAAGYSNLTLSADAVGSGEVLVTAKPEKGREVSSRAWVWLADELWASSTRSTLECVADKRTYSVGDTATILCSMPQEKGTALVTRERDGVAWHEVMAWQHGSLLLKQKIEE